MAGGNVACFPLKNNWTGICIEQRVELARIALSAELNNLFQFPSLLFQVEHQAVFDGFYTVALAAFLPAFGVDSELAAIGRPLNCLDCSVQLLAGANPCR